VDTSPIDYRAPPRVPREGGAPTDAAEDGSRVAACRECLTTGACAAEFALCGANAKCAPFAECTVAAYCLNFSLVDLANLPECVLSCAVNSNILGQDDQSVVVIAPLLLCAQDAARCGPACNRQ
jgi:hypothetical protein